jgi:hypothetical protein
VIKEFQSVSEVFIRLAKIQGFEKDLNDNLPVESLIDAIGNAIDTVDVTQKGIDKERDSLIANIQTLNVTLENMMTSYNKIRNVELAEKTVKSTSNQILNDAMRSIRLHLENNDSKAIKLAR